MAKYTAYVELSKSYIFEVEAETDIEAEEKAMELYPSFDPDDTELNVQVVQEDTEA